VFGSVGAAKAFLVALQETVDRFGWRLGAYVVMRNQFHLAVQTPQTNLSAGMQWLQVTFATRFNRMRKENGHLFQGRYRAIVLQNEGVWARVADYIHLNPVRAGVVSIEQAANFRWSSLADFSKNLKFKGLDPTAWMLTLGLNDNEGGWLNYVDRLTRNFDPSAEAVARLRQELSRGWAVGSTEWQTTLVKSIPAVTEDNSHAEYLEPMERKRLIWDARLTEILAQKGIKAEDVGNSRNSAQWKVSLACQLQQELGCSVVWLAKVLNLGKPASARAYLYRERRRNSHITT